LVKFEPTNKS